MVDRRDNDNFATDILKDFVFDGILEKAIEWIQANLEPEQVFDDGDLCDWAESNGYTKEGE